MLQGYKTLIFNILTTIIALSSTKFNLGIDPQTQTEIISGVYAIGNIILRFATNGKVGEKRA